MWKSNFYTWNFELQLHKKLVFQAQHVNHWKKIEIRTHSGRWVLISCYRICVLGTANGWFLRIQSKVHIDQVIEGFAQNCSRLERLEIQWDPDTIRFSDKSNKFVDHIRWGFIDWVGTIKMEYNICFSVFFCKTPIKILSLLSTIVEYTCIRQSSDFETIKDPLWISKTSIAYLLQIIWTPLSPNKLSNFKQFTEKLILTNINASTQIFIAKK